MVDGYFSLLLRSKMCILFVGMACTLSFKPRLKSVWTIQRRALCMQAGDGKTQQLHV